MRLSASATGAGVPAFDFAGHVAEVHTRAILLAIAEDRLATCLAPEVGRQPGGITVDAKPGLSFHAVVDRGAEFAVRGGVLRLGGALTVDLRTALPWRCNLGTLQLDIGKPAVAAACRTAVTVLRADGRGDTLCASARTAIERLAAATQRRDLAAAEQAMSRLIGFGEGRTPAGDDFLVGYFAALWAAGHASQHFARILGAPLVAMAQQTEALSRFYLEAAAAGEVSERIATVAAGIAAGSDAAEIGLTVTAALAVGHSSGAAAVCGLLQGCAACADASA